MDARAVIQAFKAQRKPPYECPLCRKTYKSFSGAEYHILRARHADDGSWVPSTPSRLTPRSPKYKRKQRKNASSAATPLARPKSPSSPPDRVETLSFEDSQRLVLFDLKCGAERWPIEDCIDVETRDETVSDSLEMVRDVDEVGDDGRKRGKDVEEEEGKEEEEDMVAFDDAKSDIVGGDDAQVVRDEVGETSESMSVSGEYEGKSVAAKQRDGENVTDERLTSSRDRESDDELSVVAADLEASAVENVEKCDDASDAGDVDCAQGAASDPRPTNDDAVDDEAVVHKAPPVTRKPGQTPKARKTPKNSRKVQPPSLPKADFRDIEDLPPRVTIGEEPFDFRTFESMSISQLEETVEYDMDEEDCEWLKELNKQRESEGVACVSDSDFELLMDRLEKESCFESHREGDAPEANIDENAVCCICQDGECQNSNAILFCDMCNMAVHQECYGVPYIPEGQWLCRRCLHSPSRPVDCCLCPNKGGAFKQTDNGQWAHVVCALWIPEVGFANPVFLEPIDGINEIPAARWRLNCCICRRCQGAAIQCVRANCYTAFHPTCAQQAGLYLKVEPATDSRTGEPTVRKVALCDVHTQLDSGCSTAVIENENVGDEIHNVATASPRRRSNAMLHDKIRQQAQENFKKSRHLLEERGKQAMPVVSVPRVSVYRLGKIASQVTISKKLDFVMRLQAYWMLKRQSRSGVPLLRRLQATQQLQRSATEEEEEVAELKKQIQLWQTLQHDLESSQMLLELIQKRENLKREILEFQQQVTSLKLDPFTIILQQMVNVLKARDTSKVFLKPVSIHEVRDYLDVIDNPMDLSTMEMKAKQHKYANIDQFVSDFDLMVNNAMIYNDKESYYYRAAMKMREVGGAVIRSFKHSLVQTGIDEKTGMHSKELPCVTGKMSKGNSISIPPTSARPDLPADAQLKDLQKKLAAAYSIRHVGARVQRVKQLKKEIGLLRRTLAKDPFYIPVRSAVKSERPQATGLYATLTAHRRSLRGPAPQPGSKEEKESKRIHWNVIDMGVRRWAKECKVENANATSETDDSRDDNYSPDTTNLDEGDSCGEDHSDNDQSVETRGDTTRQTETDEFENVKEQINRARVKSNKKKIRRKYERRRSSQRKERSISRDSSCDLDSVVNGPSVQSDRNDDNPSPHVTPTVKTVEPHRTEAQQENEADTPNNHPMTHKNRLARQPQPIREQPVATPPHSLKPKRCRRGIKRTSSVHSETTQKRPCLDQETSQKETVTTNGIETIHRRDWTPPNGLRLSTSSDFTSKSEREISQTPSVPSPRSLDSNPCRTSSVSSTDSHESVLSPLTLVWAKCRGYPSYPALIVDPEIPRDGFCHNGVPIPVPPDEVLELKHEEYDYLVLFFDARRTWQWLPRLKLNYLGANEEVDQLKLQEGKKTSWKRSVQEAFKRAIAHQQKVNGELPVTSESECTESGEDDE